MLMIRHEVDDQRLIEMTRPQQCEFESVDFLRRSNFFMAAVETRFVVVANVTAMNSKENHAGANDVELVS